jgi:integrase
MELGSYGDSGVKLTAKRVLKFIKKPGRYGDGDGLYLQVNTPGRGSWILRYERNGRERAMGLGALVTFNLAEARQRAKEARQLLADGIDPLDHKQAKREQEHLAAARTVTFERCSKLYYEAHADEWGSQRHRQQFVSSMRDYVYPVIGSTSVGAIDTPLVLKTLAPIWKTKTVTAKRIRNRIAAVLDYAAASKFRTGTNPARWEGHLEHLLAAPEKIAPVKHHPALPHDELAGFIVELQKVEGVPARALEFTILAAARTNEASEAVWREIDFEERAWTIPAERMKASREHRVPLSDRAIELLKQLPREADNPYVFIGPKPRSNIGPVAMYRLLRTLRAGVSVHGFRSSFSDWAHDTTGYSNHVIELSLAHSIGSATEKAYRRGDLLAKRRRLMADWARYCSTPKMPAAVVSIRRGHHA